METKAGTDERFYTPRSSARRGYSSASSEDERFVSPRESARSASSDDNEYTTPRETAVGVVPRLPHAGMATSPPASYKDAAFRAGSKQWVGDPYFDCKPPTSQRHFSNGGMELRHASPPADDFDLFSAARHNRLDSVAYMLDQGVSVNSQDAYGNTLLSIACQNGLKRMAKLALRRGANINAQNHRGNTALHFCFAYGYGDSLGAYLISKGADTTVENDEGCVCYYGIAQGSARK